MKNGQGHQQKAQRPQQKRPITREEVAILLHDAPRSFKPVVDGRVFIPTVVVSRRTDIRFPLYDYVTGYTSILATELETNEPLDREKLQFVPRTNIPHDDAIAFVKLLSKAQTEIALMIANTQKAVDGLLTHRLRIPEVRSR